MHLSLEVSRKVNTAASLREMVEQQSSSITQSRSSENEAAHNYGCNFRFPRSAGKNTRSPRRVFHRVSREKIDIVIACPPGIETTDLTKTSRARVSPGKKRERKRHDSIHREARLSTTTACTSLTLLNADSFTLNRAPESKRLCASKAAESKEGGPTRTFP